MIILSVGVDAEGRSLLVVERTTAEILSALLVKADISGYDAYYVTLEFQLVQKLLGDAPVAVYCHTFPLSKVVFILLLRKKLRLFLTFPNFFRFFLNFYLI